MPCCEFVIVEIEILAGTGWHQNVVGRKLKLGQKGSFQFCKNLRYNSDIKTSRKVTLSDVTGTLGEIEGALNVFLSLSFGLGCRYSSLFLLGES